MGSIDLFDRERVVLTRRHSRKNADGLALTSKGAQLPEAVAELAGIGGLAAHEAKQMMAEGHRDLFLQLDRVGERIVLKSSIRSRPWRLWITRRDFLAEDQHRLTVVLRDLHLVPDLVTC